MKTSSERQSDLRERKKESGHVRLNIWIDSHAFNALNEVASFHGMTQAMVLNDLLLGLRNTKIVTQSLKYPVSKETSKGQATAVTASHAISDSESKKMHRKSMFKKPEIQNTGPIKVTQSPQKKDKQTPPPPIQKSLWDDS